MGRGSSCSATMHACRSIGGHIASQGIALFMGDSMSCAGMTCMFKGDTMRS